MTRTTTISCDEASCHRTTVWDGDGVNESPPGWDYLWDDDELLDACPEHGPFIHSEPPPEAPFKAALVGKTLGEVGLALDSWTQMLLSDHRSNAHATQPESDCPICAEHQEA